MTPARALKPHHDHMLIIKVKSSARDLTRSDAQERSPGLAALRIAERDGLVRHIFHLRRRRGLKGARNVASHVREAARDAARGRRDGGALLIHLHDRVPLAALRRSLARDPHVDYVALVPSRYVLASAPPRAIPFPLEREWNLRRIQWPEARKLKRFRPADGLRVAVLDSGVDVRHPSLQASIGEYVYRHSDLPTTPSGHDLLGHGTHITGIIAAHSRSPFGVHGICRCRLTMHKVFVDHAAFDPVHDLFLYVVDPVLYRRALADCVERDADVINVSLGGPGEPDPYEDALLQALLQRGASIVAAMGNGRTIGSPTMYPAAVPGVIAVGATDQNDVVAPFSSRGSHSALCAPGVGIWSTLPRYPGQFGFHAGRDIRGRRRAASPLSRNVWYDAWPGTSMATPHVTAAAALLRASRPGIAGPEVRERLMRTADHVPGMGRMKFTPDYGSGRLNLRRLLAD
ncbi:MAG: S8 family peptidase [Gemmatimonadaceae bacterium]